MYKNEIIAYFWIQILIIYFVKCTVPIGKVSASYVKSLGATALQSSSNYKNWFAKQIQGK